MLSQNQQYHWMWKILTKLLFGSCREDVSHPRSDTPVLRFQCVLSPSCTTDLTVWQEVMASLSHGKYRVSVSEWGECALTYDCGSSTGRRPVEAREALYLSRAIFVQIWRPGEAKHLVLSLSVCTVYELECLTDLEPSSPSPLPQFLLVLSVGVSWGTKKEKGLGHIQNDFHCCISAFGRMQFGACQEKKEINDPRARARSGPIEVWSEEERGCLLPRPSRANWRIWSSGENSMM